MSYIYAYNIPNTSLPPLFITGVQSATQIGPQHHQFRCLYPEE